MYEYICILSLKSLLKIENVITKNFLNIYMYEKESQVLILINFNTMLSIICL